MRELAGWVLVGLATLVALGNWVGWLFAARRRRSGSTEGFSFVPLLFRRGA